MNSWPNGSRLVYATSQCNGYYSGVLGPLLLVALWEILFQKVHITVVHQSSSLLEALALFSRWSCLVRCGTHQKINHRDVTSALSFCFFSVRTLWSGAQVVASFRNFLLWSRQPSVIRSTGDSRTTTENWRCEGETLKRSHKIPHTVKTTNVRFFSFTSFFLSALVLVVPHLCTLVYPIYI